MCNPNFVLAQVPAQVPCSVKNGWRAERMDRELYDRHASGTELIRANTPIAKASHVRRPPAAIKTLRYLGELPLGTTRSEFARH